MVPGAYLVVILIPVLAAVRHGGVRVRIVFLDAASSDSNMGINPNGIVKHADIEVIGQSAVAGAPPVLVLALALAVALAGRRRR